VNDELLATLKGMVPEGNILENEEMSRHTTFRVGGPAGIMVMVDNDDQLSSLIRYMNLVERPYFILGNGSNLLVSDKGYDGVIFKLSGEYTKLKVSENRIETGAAVMLSAVARMAAENGLSGMEFASGIPGSVGGAIVMNAGAYDGEMSRIVESVTVVGKDGEILTLDNDTMEFGYRKSVIKNYNYVVTKVTLKLSPGNKSEILDMMEDFAQRRRSKQPLEFPSAGSTFKRPEGYFAGKLIMDAGLRGFSIGGARVSDKHCGFVVNQGNASASDIYDVICHVTEVVKEKFGVTLEKEVILLGDF